MLRLSVHNRALVDPRLTSMFLILPELEEPESTSEIEFLTVYQDRRRFTAQHIIQLT